VVGTEFAELLLDVAHLFMWCLCWAAPWRGAAVMLVLAEKDDRWRARITDKVRPPR
jgi:hypothetical protein